MTDAQGNTVNYSFSSTSGTNFVQPVVPEPRTCATMALAGAGTLLVTLRRRRRTALLCLRQGVHRGT